MEFPLNDGPIFLEGVVLRSPGQRSGRVFGRELRETGRAWGVYGAGSVEEGLEEYEKRRRACLPAVVIRAVEYREFDESIFKHALADSKWRNGVRKKKASSESVDARPIYQDYEKSSTQART